MYEVVRKNYEDQGVVTIIVYADSYKIGNSGEVTFFKNPPLLPKVKVVSYPHGIWFRINPVENYKEND